MGTMDNYYSDRFAVDKDSGSSSTKAPLALNGTVLSIDIKPIRHCGKSAVVKN
jgi:hypothetical protein